MLMLSKDKMFNTTYNSSSKDKWIHYDNSSINLGQIVRIAKRPGRIAFCTITGLEFDLEFESQDDLKKEFERIQKLLAQ